MLRVYKGRPYCEYCWEDMPPVFAPDIDDGEPLMWRDLEPFVPEHDKRIAEQQAEIEALKAKIDRLTSRGIEDMKARIAELEDSVRFFAIRCEELQEIQSRMRDPERQMVCDILANGKPRDKAGIGEYKALLPGGDHGVVDRLG
jgi:hypothetical protein